jgi:hypothetical protein
MLDHRDGEDHVGWPVRYVVFRKEGLAINPGRWWAKADQRRVRG